MSKRLCIALIANILCFPICTGNAEKHIWGLFRHTIFAVEGKEDGKGEDHETL